MLDPAGRLEIIDLIKQLRKQQSLTVLSITHDIDEAAGADQVLLLDDGQVKEIGTPAEIFQHGEALLHLGLDVPYPEKLKNALAKRGVKMPAGYLDEEGLAKALWTLHSTM